MKTYKLLLLGDGAVGKTSLINYNITKKFNTEYIPTNGVDVRELILKDKDIAFQIWDCGGKNQGLTEAYYFNADCAIIMFDVTNEDSLILSNYIKNLNLINSTIPLVFVANKIDAGRYTIANSIIKKEYRRVTKIINMSVKLGINIQEPFDVLIKILETKDK